MFPIQVIKDNEITEPIQRTLVNNNLCSISFNDHDIECKRRKSSSPLSSTTFNIYSDNEKVGNVRGMYHRDKKHGEFGTTFYSEYKDDEFVAYVMLAPSGKIDKKFQPVREHIVIMQQPNAWSVAARRRFPFTPKQKPIAFAMLTGRTPKKMYYTVYLSQDLPLSEEECLAQVAIFLSYLDLAGRDERKKYCHTTAYEIHDEDEHYKKQMRQMFDVCREVCW